MRRVHASIKVGRRGKRNKETKGIQGGGALRGARLRPQRVHPGQESPVPEKQELQTILLDGKVRSQGVGAGSQEGRGCPQAPRDTNRGPAPWGRVPHPAAELSKGLQPSRLGLGAAPAAAPPRGGCLAQERFQQCRPRNTGCWGTQPGMGATPGTSRGREGTGCSCHWAPRTGQISSPRPQSIQAPAD